MFNNINDNINYSDCMATELIKVSNRKIAELNPPSEASKAVLQFYTYNNGCKVIDFCIAQNQPIASVLQSDEKPEPSYKGKGFKIPNMGCYHVSGIKNIGRTKFIPFQRGYVLFCFVQYFR